MAATGFLGAGAFPTQLTEAEFESARYNELDDMVATTGVAFLGLSVGCAPLSRSQVRPHPLRRLLPHGRCLHHHDPQRDRYRTRTRREAGEGPGHGRGVSAHEAQRRRPRLPSLLPEDVQLARGDVAQKLAEAKPGVLRVLGSGDGTARWRVKPSAARRPGTSYRRSALGGWLTDPDYGAGRLAARVIVNRLWQHHFGRGIVATPNDFGTQGSPPSHPELLDWLAGALIDNGWRLKPIHRLIVTSAVYMQDNRYDDARAGVDRENVFLWRRPPRRLEAEPIRDAMLATAGRLDAADVRPRFARSRDAAPEPLFLHQAEPAGPDDDALRLARAPGEHRPAQHDDDRAQALAMLNSALPRTAPRVSRRGWPAATAARKSRGPIGSPSAANRPGPRPGWQPRSWLCSARPMCRTAGPSPIGWPSSISVRA